MPDITPSRSGSPMEPQEAFLQLGRLDLGALSLAEVMTRVAELAKATVAGATEVSVTLIEGDSARTVAFTGDLAEVERADVMGYSQGGGVALQLALRHPQLVTKLVTLSATYRRDGWYPSALAGLEGLTPDFFADTPVGEAFRQHTGCTEAFDAYIEKVRVLGIEDQNISDAQLRSIQARTMVIAGDADGVKPEHAVAMFKLRGGGDEEAAATGVIPEIPRARLVILPATSHISISGAALVLEPMITAFLDDVPPANPSLW